MFSFVLVHVHIVKVSCIILSQVYHGERYSNLAHTQATEHLVADKVSNNLGS